MEPERIQIDGSVFEGGGQIIRSCLALSVILKKPFFIHSIRKNRPNSGLNNQLRAILFPFMKGMKVPPNGSDQLAYTPIIPDIDKISSNTSSSCTLMLQALIPIAAMLEIQKKLVVEGGTDVSKSPPLQSIQKCLLPLLSRMGLEVKFDKVKKGYYPKGGGSIVYSVTCKHLKAIDLTKFEVPKEVLIRYYLKTNDLPQSHKELRKDIKKMMRQAFGEDLELDIQIEVEVTSGTKGGKHENYGIGCILQNDNVVWDCSHVGQTAKESMILQRLKHEIGNRACLDEHHQDQLIIFMALAEGTSRINIGKHKSDHTKSMIYVLSKFLPDLKVSFEGGLLEITGINLLGSK